jgi:hypothetical protein
MEVVAAQPRHVLVSSVAAPEILAKGVRRVEAVVAQRRQPADGLRRIDEDEDAVPGRALDRTIESRTKYASLGFERS